MMFKPATFLFICAVLLLTTFASAVVHVAGVVDGAVASQPVGGVPGGLRATNAAATVVVTTDNNNDGRRKLQSNKWNWCRKECLNTRTSINAWPITPIAIHIARGTSGHMGSGNNEEKCVCVCGERGTFSKNKYNVSGGGGRT
jgi:hypothetical protein